MVNPELGCTAVLDVVLYQDGIHQAQFQGVSMLILSGWGIFVTPGAQFQGVETFFGLREASHFHKVSPWGHVFHELAEVCLVSREAPCPVFSESEYLLLS